jgi:DNA helicase-2/ATP-dependent DNA helicase PcrA
MLKPTPAQLDIKAHPGLDLLITAPAGCGKTEALGLRVAGLIDQGAVAAPRKVLVTTFSNRARDNIRDRIRTHVSPTSMRDRVTIANFHGISARIFKAHAEVIGLDPGLLIPDSDWVGEECRRQRVNLTDAAAVSELLRRIKQEAVDDAAVMEQLEAAGNSTAIQIEQLRVSEGRLTYDDLPRVAELILAHDEVADAYSNHFSAVIVDEFQDLTPQQLRIVNRIGAGRTTYAGDLAQGIYTFAGARPQDVYAAIKVECNTTIELNESHRSSPGVLNAVNALSSLTGATPLKAADPDSWPGGGIAAVLDYSTVEQEAAGLLNLCRHILSRAPDQRIGVLSRTGGRRRFIDDAVAASDLPSYRWEDGVFDTETARLLKTMLPRLDRSAYDAADDPVTFLRQAVDYDGIQDPATREGVASAIAWCVDLLNEHNAPAEIRARIRVGDATTLLNVPGVHLLNAHIGKGQQFDWVLIVGAEDGSIPFFLARDAASRQEEARIFGVMLSRARHGMVVTHAASVPAQDGRVFNKDPSPFLVPLRGATADRNGLQDWLQRADWDAIAAR